MLRRWLVPTSHGEAALWSFILYYIPRVGYSIPVLSLSERNCHEIQSPAINAVLPKMHVNRNTSHSIIFGPKTLGGLGLPHLYTYSNISKLQLFTGHLRLQDKTGKLIMIGLSHMQLLVGTGTLFLNEQYDKYSKEVPEGWLTSVWGFSSKAKLTFDIADHWLPVSQRQGDKFLMELFHHQSHPSTIISILNRCRIYLNVITVADIVSADGTHILPWVKQGHRHKDRHSTLNWPNQEKPPPKDWKIWTQALSRLETREKLTDPLGCWTGPSHQTWHGYVDSSFHYYEQSSHNTWEVFKPFFKPSSTVTRASTKVWYDTTSPMTTTPPNSPRPATKYIDTSSLGNLFYVTHSTSELVPRLTPGVKPNLLNHPFYTRLLGPLTDEQKHLEEVAAAAIHGPLYLCCDGSHDPIRHIASHGWVIADSYGNPLWEGSGPVDGVPSQLNPYRAEKHGLLGVLHLLLRLDNYHNIGSAKAIVYCDNLKAIKGVSNQSPLNIKQATSDDYDVFLELKSLQKELQIQTEMTWVKGHYEGQDQHFKYNLNKIAHKAAVTFLKAPHPDFMPKSIPLLLPTHRVTVYHNNLTLLSNLRQTILHKIHNNPLKEKLLKDNRWNDKTFNRIHWDAFRLAVSSISRSHQISICKLTNGLWNTNEQNHKFYGTSSKCPFCSSPETLSHIFTCGSSKATSYRQEAIQEFQKKLSKLKTHSKISEAIVSGLGQWAQSLGVDTPTPIVPFRGSINSMEVLITQAYTVQQTDIGWLQFLQGKVSTYWSEAYTLSLPKSQNKTKKGLQWGKHLILGVWSYSKMIWEHRNKEIHGNSIHESKRKTRQKLEKEVRYFYASHADNPFLILRRDSYLFDKDVEDHLLLPPEHLTAWLRSVKEAVLVRKHHYDLAGLSRKQWFKDFFVKKKPTCSGSKTASSTARPLPSIDNNSLEPGPKNAPLISMAHTPTPRSHKPTIKPRLIRVKGCTRLFKYSHKPVQKTLSHSRIPPQLHSDQDRRMVVPLRNAHFAHMDHTHPTDATIDILMHPSGLRMPPLLHKKSVKLMRKVCLDKKIKNQTKERKSGKENKVREEIKYPLQGSLEAYGFRARLPKKSNLVSTSTLEAEEESSEYSGTYISTVP
jgi:hypothetical protein